jgi:hypothetical protein
MMRSLLERLMQEEWATPTKANGYSTRDLQTKVGPIPRVREGNDPTVAAPSLELSDTPPG